MVGVSVTVGVTVAVEVWVGAGVAVEVRVGVRLGESPKERKASPSQEVSNNITINRTKIILFFIKSQV
jgi:hypothetical protein